MFKIILPELGEGIERAVVACWHIEEGARVNSGDDVVEVVTDKATFNVSAGMDGIVMKILVSAGQEARIGDTLALINSNTQS